MFPNASYGVKKIFTAEIIQLIALVILAAVSILAVIMTVNQANGQEAANVVIVIVTLVLILAAVVLVVISSILSIIGLARAGKDDRNFKIALYFVILSAAAAIIGAIFKALGSTGYDVCDTVARVADLCISLFIIRGIVVLAEKLSNDEVAKKGNRLYWIFFIIYALSIVAMFTYTLFFANVVSVAIGAVITIVAAVLSIIAYILYLILLAKAKKMLA